MTESVHSKHSKYWVIIPAAGSGSRMQIDCPKQYLILENKTVLEHTLDCFLNNAAITSTFVAIGDHDDYWQSLNLDGRDNLIKVQGGQERCHSVFNALLMLMPMADLDDWVLVHDAARPCLGQEDLDHLIKRLEKDEVGGLLAVPVKDTMKRGNAADKVTETVDRNNLWHALTPQMFRLGTLFNAMKLALDSHYLVTDEASAIEYAGFSPVLVEGSADNIKITLPEDLQLARFFLQQQGRIPT
ncbi:MAG: 2-C-methyl-D-erythritol 4-phosphate cytidylyltransferase [Gammaproteobacteria bacterium]|nr:2-C-methyl-D-erythritol 4-phosphate cytidylyltransferase [Gammaproteobacteria bacterium]